MIRPEGYSSSLSLYRIIRPAKAVACQPFGNSETIAVITFCVEIGPFGNATVLPSKSGCAPAWSTLSVYGSRRRKVCSADAIGVGPERLSVTFSSRSIGYSASKLFALALVLSVFLSGSLDKRRREIRG